MAHTSTHERGELRSFDSQIELRPDEGQAATLIGTAAVFNTETVIGSSQFGFREQIAVGAFDGALQRPDDVRALFNHDPNIVLGRTTSGTLRLTTTDAGLRYEVDLPETAAAKDVMTLVRRGDVTGSSFGFKVTDDEWDESGVTDGNLPLRTIKTVELWDISAVTYPAYQEASVSARAKAEALSGREVVPGIVPRNISTRLTGRETEWTPLVLADFTDDPWDELSSPETRRIARHFAWSAAMPPAAFEDLQLPHHRASDGAVVLAAVDAALCALHEAEIPAADVDRVRAHLEAHRRAFGEAVALDLARTRRNDTRDALEAARAWMG
jgi:uncharacterized protein